MNNQEHNSRNFHSFMFKIFKNTTVNLFIKTIMKQNYRCIYHCILNRKIIVENN